MLTLPIKKKWFDMIKSGEKKEEYREIKPYWTKRLGFISDNKELTVYQVNKNILLRNGYSKNSPTLKCYVQIKKDYGKPEWGAEPNRLYYVLKILNLKEIEMNREEYIGILELENAELKKQLKEIQKIEITYDLKDMIICALRYAIGCKIYETKEVSSFIKSHPELIDKRVKEVMLKDLKGIDRYYKENDIDYPIFKSLENWLNKIEV